MQFAKPRIIANLWHDSLLVRPANRKNIKKSRFTRGQSGDFQDFIAPASVDPEWPDFQAWRYLV
jgi:hypothetical protein